MNEPDWPKDEDGYPKERRLKVKMHIKCQRCPNIMYVEYDSNCGDSLNLHCQCGAYYKKAIRIKEEQILKKELESYFE